MVKLSVRKRDNQVVTKLRLRAAQKSVSMEEEVRPIIIQAIAAPIRLSDMAIEYFGTEAGVDLELDKQPAHDPVDL